MQGLTSPVLDPVLANNGMHGGTTTCRAVLQHACQKLLRRWPAPRRLAGPARLRLAWLEH